MPSSDDHNAESAAPSLPVKVGLYCWQCRKVRHVDGSPIESGWPSRCGVDYGPDHDSHLVVWPVYALPPDSMAVIDAAHNDGRTTDA